MSSADLPVLTAQQAAEYLGIHLQTFYRKAGQGEIPGAQKVGGTWLVETEELRKGTQDEKRRTLEPA